MFGVLYSRCKHNESIDSISSRNIMPAQIMQNGRCVSSGLSHRVVLKVQFSCHRVVQEAFFGLTLYTPLHCFPPPSRYVFGTEGPLRGRFNNRFCKIAPEPHRAILTRYFALWANINKLKISRQTRSQSVSDAKEKPSHWTANRHGWKNRWKTIKNVKKCL